jgi:hypothetical protein
MPERMPSQAVPSVLGRQEYDAPSVLMTREEAASQGLQRYFTGIPCKHGHISYRYVANTMCLTCVRERASPFKKNPYTDHLVHYQQQFWVPRNTTPAEYERLRAYLDQCIKAFYAAR